MRKKRDAEQLLAYQLVLLNDKIEKEIEEEQVEAEKEKAPA
jgi:hypothetical protein